MTRWILASILLVSAVSRSEPLGIDEAMALARSTSEGLELSRMDLEAVKARRSQAFGALLPVATLGSDLSRTGPNAGDEGRFNAASRTSGDLVWKNTIGLRWTVFDGFRSWNAMRSLDLRTRAQEVSVQATTSAVEEQVDARWASLWLASRRLELVREILATSRKRREIAGHRRQLGVVSGLEERQAALDLDRDSLAAIRAEQDRDAASRALDLAIGREPTGVTTPAEPPVPDTMDPLGAREPLTTPGIESARRTEEAARAEARAASGTWWPELALYADYQHLGVLQEEPPPEDDWHQGMIYGARATWTVFEGGRNLGRSREASSNAARARIQRAAREREAVSALEQSRSRWVSAVRGWSLQRSAGEQSGAILKAALTEYAAGGLSGLDLRRYQDSDAQARLDADAARMELLLSARALRRSAGYGSIESP